MESVGFTAAIPAQWRLPAVLAVTLPARLGDARTRHALRFDHGVSVAGGLGPTAGRIWRLGLMGETARAEHYHRLFVALADLLDAPHLPTVFERSLAACA
jgi:alanine-glyoxylate transaminase/serine-glyoxylate transaminase/serine-pyruvate transaminase